MMLGLKRILGGACGHARGMAIAVAALSAMMLVACGQKGPLFLAEPASAAARKPANTATPDTPPAAPAQR
jgi:predicted small lipoprotein YifL